MHLKRLSIIGLLLCYSNGGEAQVPKLEKQCRTKVIALLTRDGGIGIPEDVPLPKASAAVARDQLVNECVRYIRKYGDYPESCPCPLR